MVTTAAQAVPVTEYISTRSSTASYRASVVELVISTEQSVATVCEVRDVTVDGEEPATKLQASHAAKANKREQRDGASGMDRSEDRPDRNGGERRQARSSVTGYLSIRSGLWQVWLEKRIRELKTVRGR
jgi:hypothetical protein